MRTEAKMMFVLGLMVTAEEGKERALIYIPNGFERAVRQGRERKAKGATMSE